MAIGIKASVANSLLDELLKNTNYVPPAAVYYQLHTADPGAAGTTAVAGNSTRKQATFGSATGGVSTTTADMTWTSVSTTETYSHVSAWDAATTGNFLFSDDLAASKAVTAGDTFTLPAGSVTVTITQLAA